MIYFRRFFCVFFGAATHFFLVSTVHLFDMHRLFVLTVPEMCGAACRPNVIFDLVAPNANLSYANVHGVLLVHNPTSLSSPGNLPGEVR